MTELILEREQTTSAIVRTESLPFISVIVPVRNEERFLARTLDQLLGQSYPSQQFEILIADGRSTDRTREVVRQMQTAHPNVRLLDNPRRWSSAGRNVAARAARGDLIVLVDGHCQIDTPHYLEEIAIAFQSSGASCLGRPQPLDVSGATPLQQAIALARSSRLGHHPSSHIYSSQAGFVPAHSVAIAYRREVFGQVGFFDETFDACEDVELNHRIDRAGLRCYFTPRVQVRYHPRSSLMGLFRQMMRYGRGRVRLLRKHPETFTLQGSIPALFVAGLFGGPLVAWMLPPLGYVYLGVLALYLLLVLGFSTALARRQRQACLLPWLPLAFFAIHLGAGMGLLRELLGGRSSAPMPSLNSSENPGG